MQESAHRPQAAQAHIQQQKQGQMENGDVRAARVRSECAVTKTRVAASSRRRCAKQTMSAGAERPRSTTGGRRHKRARNRRERGPIEASTKSSIPRVGPPLRRIRACIEQVGTMPPLVMRSFAEERECAECAGHGEQRPWHAHDLNGTEGTANHR